MGVRFRIKNQNNGPWKPRFIAGTPREILENVAGVLKTGKTMVIPSDAVPFLDMVHLERCRALGVIAVREIHTAPPVALPAKPLKHVEKRPTKDDKSKPATDTKSEKGGK